MASRTTDPRRDGTHAPDERPTIELPPVPEIDEDDEETADYAVLVARTFGSGEIAELKTVQAAFMEHGLADLRRLLALARVNAQTTAQLVDLIEAEITARESDVADDRAERELAHKEQALAQNERLLRQQDEMRSLMERQMVEDADNPFGGPISLSGLKG